MARAVRLVDCLCLSRHGREHIECAFAMQSVRTRSDNGGSQRFEPSIAPISRRSVAEGAGQCRIFGFCAQESLRLSFSRVKMRIGLLVVSSVAGGLYNMNDRISISPDDAICVRKD